MLTDNFEIINLNPNINYDSSDDETDVEEEENTIMECISVNDDDESMHSNSHDLFSHPEVKTRKKLNLEEYKQKRANQPARTFNTTGTTTLELCEIIPDTLPAINLPSDPRAIKKFLSKINSKQQDEEEVQHDIESTEQVSTTTANVIYPAAIHPDYEEIICVSIQCNTDISILPNEHEEQQTGAKFLTNIVNNFQNDKFVNSSANSLFSSINEVMQKKCEAQSVSDQVVVNSKMEEHHGEDKVIMHLRKDRIRKGGKSIAVQTDITPLFPSLVLSPALIFNRIRNVRSYRRKTSRSRSRSRSRSLSPESSEYYTGGSYFNFSNNPFVTRSHNSAYSSSITSSELDTNSSDSDDSSAYSSERSSNQGSIKRFENTYRNYRQQKYNDGSGNKIQEERKIIYVGEILKETTKEELRRKFIKYGSIKKISLHAREDGSLRYGFVTFAESSVAYEVIDKFVTDPALCNYDIRFGGRRKFCKQNYADLDNGIDAVGIGQGIGKISNKISTKINNNINNIVKSNELSFEDLLNMAKRKLQAAKK